LAPSQVRRYERGIFSNGALSLRSICLLISGSKVRVLVRPPIKSTA
jgi:hypothetical protein